MAKQETTRLLILDGHVLDKNEIDDSEPSAPKFLSYGHQHHPFPGKNTQTRRINLFGGSPRGSTSNRNRHNT